VKDRRRLDDHQDKRLRELSKQLSRDVTLGDEIAGERIQSSATLAQHHEPLAARAPGSMEGLDTIETRPAEDPRRASVGSSITAPTTVS